jgi:hypothetical protein
MSRLLVLSSIVVVITVGCAGANVRPLVDMKGVNEAAYEKDLSECQAYAQQQSGMGETAAKGAGAGAVVGGYRHTWEGCRCYLGVQPPWTCCLLWQPPRSNKGDDSCRYWPYSVFSEITINIYLLLAKYKYPYINPMVSHGISCTAYLI